MMEVLWPSYDAWKVWVEPWVERGEMSLWIVLMGFLVIFTCGIAGHYLLLRRMALMGDAISHSLLAGIVIVFLVFNTAAWLGMFLGAAVMGVVTVFLIEVLYRQSRVPVDAAMCITFTSLFALGVVLLGLAERSGSIHLDAECLLFGEIAFVALEEPWKLRGVPLGPPSVWIMGGVCAVVCGLVALFYKELLVTAFDGGFARSIGMRAGAWYYGVMVGVSIVIVASLQAVGVVLVVAMLILPGMFAAELSMRLPVRFIWTAVYAALASLGGYHLAVWWNCSVAGAMVVAGAFIFQGVWAGRRMRLGRWVSTMGD